MIDSYICHKYYVSGHYLSFCFYLKSNVSETGFCLHLQVKPTQLDTIDRASPYLRTTVPAPRWAIKAKHSTNHLRELRQILRIIKGTPQALGLASEYFPNNP
jgi:hypothetical protein